MRDVAQRAGVSLKTVSRVYRGERGVASKTATAVRKAMVDVGYRPNATAVAFREGAPGYIAILVGREHLATATAFLTTIADHLADEALGLQLAIIHATPAARGRAGAGHNLSRTLGAIALSDGRRVPDLPAELPLVIAGTPMPASNGAPSHDAVTWDEADAAGRVTRRLLATGADLIVFVGDSTAHSGTAARLRGHREALRATGHAPDPAFEVIEDSPDRARRVLDSVLDAVPARAAFLCATTSLAGLLLERLAAAGRPEAAVALCGPVPAQLTAWPSLRPGPLDPAALGTQATELLLERLDGRLPARPVRRRLALDACDAGAWVTPTR